MKPIILVPLVALVLVGGSAGAYLAVTSEDSVEEATVAQPTAAPTPTPTPAEGPLPTATPTAIPAPAAEGGKAPDGCLAGELAYVDPDGRFAFCYAADMELVTVDTGEGIAPTVRHPVTDVNRVVVTFVWTAEGRVGVVPNAPCFENMPIVKNERIEEHVFAARNVQACFQDHYDPAQPEVLSYTSVDFEIAVSTGGVIQVSIAQTGPDWMRQGVPLPPAARCPLATIFRSFQDE